jgi:putative membrane protein
MRRLTLALIALSSATPAWAHVAGESAGETWETVSILLCLGLYAFVYLSGYLQLRQGARPVAAGRTQLAWFVGSLVTFGLALLRPMSRLAEQLFSFHMAQHLLLMLAAAPLVVASRPVYVALWALPRSARKAIGRAGAQPAVAWLPALLRSPLVIWMAFTGVFVFWHLPAAYGYALSHNWAHAVEHVSFVLVACGFWDVVIEPSGRRRIDHGAAVLYVATAAVLSSMPGALMVLTQRPLYGVHAETVAAWGLTEIQDQQLAGLIMWIPAGFAYLTAIVVQLVLWLRDSERRARLRVALHARNAGWVLLIAVLLAGCEDRGASYLAKLGFKQPKSDIGDIDAGRRGIVTYGCGACHVIPGIAGANGMVGPPLDRMGRRVYIAGLLRNSPENMTSWLLDPQKVVPGNAMPVLGLTEEQARNITAYLYTLD